VAAHPTLIIALVTAEPDPYAVLGVGRDATTSSISAAYRALARRHHPDVSGDLNAQRRMAVINAAWAILRDPERRADWDREHAAPSSTPSQAPTPRSGGGHAARPAATTQRTWTPSSRAQPSTPGWRRGPHGEGAAGPPPGNPRGSVLTFGRHIGWSLGEIARVDPGYLHWLAGHREGGRYRAEIDAILAPMMARPEEPPQPKRRRAIFR
jgi:hypothetical protein